MRCAEQQRAEGATNILNADSCWWRRLGSQGICGGTAGAAGAPFIPTVQRSCMSALSQLLLHQSSVLGTAMP